MASKSFIDLAGLQHYDEKLNEKLDAKYVNLADSQTVTGAKTFTSTITGTRFDGAVSAYRIDTNATENTAGSIPFVARPIIDESRSCKTAFLPATNVTIEYSIDSGTTWTDYATSDDVKKDLFAMNRTSSVMIGKGTAGGTTAVDTKCRLRITFNAADRYAAVDTLYLYVTSFNHTMKVDIERSTIGAKTTFTNVRSGITVSGWGGPNLISLPSSTFGSYNTNQTSNGYAYRLTFYCTAIGANTTSYPSVHDIRLYGTTTWTAANTMMNHDSLFSWDRNQNATFPNEVTAVKFNGPATIVAPLPPVALPDTTLAVDGLQVVEVYNNSYPYAYGNVINVQGTKHRGAGQLMLSWSGSNNGIASIYYRNKRDAAATWSAWKTVAFTDSNITGTAAYAEKLGTATVGDADTPIYLNAGTATAVSSALKSCYAVVESEAVTSNIFKIASGSMGAAYNGLNAVILIQNIMGVNAAVWRISLNAGSTSGVYSSGTSVLVDNIGLSTDNFILAYKSNSGSAIDFELYAKIPARYSGYRFTVIQECWRSTQKLGSILTLHNNLTSTGSASISSGFTAIATTKANVNMDIGGNAATATKAAQDGSGNVITATYATKSELNNIGSITTAQIDTLFA